MFSSRTSWPLAKNRLAHLLDEKRAGGVEILDLTNANPTLAGIPLPEDILEALAQPGGLAYRPEPLGLLTAREAIAADYERRGHRVHPGRIVVTAGTSEAYAFVFKLLCDPGDVVLVPRPSYPLFDYLAGLESVETAGYPLEYDGEWRLDVDGLHRRITPRTKAIVVVNPNNPTGSFLKRDEAERLQRLCAESDVALLSDEVFADYAFGPDARRVDCLAGGGPGLAFSLGGLSKSCGLPQLKLAWIAVSGPPALCETALARLEIVADTYLSVSTPVQLAASSILARREALQSRIVDRVASNGSALCETLRGARAISALKIEGGWYATVRAPAIRGEEDLVADLLLRRDVLVHPGYFFDFPTEAYFVLSLLPPPQTFREGVERLVETLEEGAP